MLSCGENKAKKLHRQTSDDGVKLPFDLIVKRNNSIILSISSHAASRAYIELRHLESAGSDKANNGKLTSNYAQLGEQMVLEKRSCCAISGTNCDSSTVAKKIHFECCWRRRDFHKNCNSL